jgi:hypothetical protein
MSQQKISASEYLDQSAKAEKKRSKYGAKKVTIDGMKFDSVSEARRWQDLRVLERAGEITDLERQVKIPLFGQYGPLLTDKGNQISYVADFKYFDCNLGKVVIEDRKGFRTPEYKLKRAICAAQGIHILET